MTNWFKEKFQANLLTAVFRSTVKDYCRDLVSTYKMGPANFSDQSKTLISKWGRDRVETDLAQICASNADVIVKELQQELEFILPEAGEIPNNGSKRVMEQALMVMQSQITEISDGTAPAALDAAMEMAVMLAIFENPKSAATKTLELLKIWAEIRPGLKENVENAAKNILNFQGTKSYLTLLDFDTALFKLFSKPTQNAFRSLQRELQTAMNKTAHEIKMDPSE